jgi:hypothetical protein
MSMFSLTALIIVLGACGAAAAVFFAWRLRRAMRLHGAALTRVDQGLSIAKNDLDRIANAVLRLTQQNENFLRLMDDLKKLTHISAYSSAKPSDIVLYDNDTYDNLDQNWLSIRDTSGRKETSTVIHGECSRTAVIITLGESNAANHGAGRYAAKHRVDNFNIYDGKCYNAEDPLLGASGEGGNFATRLGDKLIEDGLFDRVILAPIGMGGTTVEQWAHHGMFSRRIPVLVRRLYDAGLTVDFILWHQGEGNSGVGDGGGRQYRKNLLEVVETFRCCGVDAPFLVAMATLCGGPHANAENIRAGQKSAVDPLQSIYQGPDTDIIGVEYRWDQCHFDELGLSLAAALWLEVIAGLRPSQTATPMQDRASIEARSKGDSGEAVGRATAR